MIRKGHKYKLEDIFIFVSPNSKKKKRIYFDGDLVKVSSDRLYVFKKNHYCCICGIAGSFFVKEKNKNDSSFHFNMYAIDVNGSELLMTKDHKIPRSLGGNNNIDNYQTMCIKCNVEKGNGIQKGTYSKPKNKK